VKRNPLAGVVALTGLAMLAGLAAIFIWAPTDCSQVINGACFEGTVQRIFYFHVPSAWVAYLAYTVVLIGAIAYLKTGSARWDNLAHSSAEVGVVFTGITLLSGMMWAKPLWGTYWRWEPRLTLTLVLFLVYVGYLTFRSMAIDENRGARVSSVIGISGFAAIPLVHFSVQWWRGQHPGPVVVDPEKGVHLPTEMLVTLLFMLVVFTLLYASLLALRVHLGRLKAGVEQLEAA